MQTLQSQTDLLTANVVAQNVGILRLLSAEAI